MYCPTAAQPAAAPTVASMLRAALWHVSGPARGTHAGFSLKAPHSRFKAAPPRSMAAALAARGTGPAARKAWLQKQYTNHCAGRPITWPPAR